MAETVDVDLESLAILCLCSHARFIVVDGLGGIIQQGGNLLAVGYTQSHQGKDANLSSQVVA